MCLHALGTSWTAPPSRDARLQTSPRGHHQEGPEGTTPPPFRAVTPDSRHHQEGPEGTTSPPFRAVAPEPNKRLSSGRKRSPQPRWPESLSHVTDLPSVAKITVHFPTSLTTPSHSCEGPHLPGTPKDFSRASPPHHSAASHPENTTSGRTPRGQQPSHGLQPPPRP